MLASRFAPHAMLGTDRRLAELADDLSVASHVSDVTCYRATAEVMADVVGFHSTGACLPPPAVRVELSVSEVLECARTIAVLEGSTTTKISARSSAMPPGSASTGDFRRRLRRSAYRRSVRVSMGHALLVLFARAARWPADSGVTARRRFPAAGDDPELASGVPRRSDDEAGRGQGRGARRRGGPGLTETVMRASDARVRVPMSRGTDSLNVATAAALAFYERVRSADR